MQYILATRIMQFSLLALSLSATGCGLVGDKGAAIFHVGNNWQKDVGIAVGSLFAVTAQKDDLTHAALSVTSTAPTVVPVLSGGFQAVTTGEAQFQATDPATAIAVDTVEFNVAAPATVSLGGWWSSLTSAPATLPQKFGLVQGGRYVGAIVVEDATGARLNHAGIAQVTCDHATVKVTDDYVEATATTLGATTAVVQIRGTAANVVATASYDVQIVQASDITHLTVTSATLQSGSSAPADADKAPVNPDPAATTTTATSQLFLLMANATLADATPVFGPTVTWSESGTGHLLAKQSNGGNYAVLKSGETVTVTVALGALTAQLILTAP